MQYKMADGYCCPMAAFHQVFGGRIKSAQMTRRSYCEQRASASMIAELPTRTKD